MPQYKPQHKGDLKWKARAERTRDGKRTSYSLGWYLTEKEAITAEEAFAVINPRKDRKGQRRPCSHPSRTCYEHHKCRCQDCRDIIAKISREWRQKNGSARGLGRHDMSVEELWDCTYTLESYWRLRGEAD